MPCPVVVPQWRKTEPPSPDEYGKLGSVRPVCMLICSQRIWNKFLVFSCPFFFFWPLFMLSSFWKADRIYVVCIVLLLPNSQIEVWEQNSAVSAAFQCFIVMDVHLNTSARATFIIQNVLADLIKSCEKSHQRSLVLMIGRLWWCSIIQHL